MKSIEHEIFQGALKPRPFQRCRSNEINLKYRRLVPSIFFALIASAQAAETYGPYSAKVLRVIDGDTIQVAVAIWPGLSQVTKLRLAGVNTPEKRGKVSDCEKRAGRAATAFTQDFLRGARIVTVSGVRPGKYAGRMLGSIQADGKHLERALLDAGHARPYRGGRRQPWCQSQ